MLEVQTLKRRFGLGYNTGSGREAEGMSIQALLNGVTSVIATAMDTGSPPSERVLARWGNNGAPYGAWKTGMGWFAGVYYLGETGGARESSKTVYRVGVDLTSMAPLKFSGKPRVDYFLTDGEFFTKLKRIANLICSSNSIVANACNTALTGTSEEGKGRFQQNFEDYTISGPRGENAEWCLLEEEEPSKVPPIVVASLSFSGLVWWEPLANLYTGP